MGYGGELCHLSKHEEARFMGAIRSRESVAWVAQMEHIGAVNKDRISCD
jgi:hypothetical protein